MDDYVIRIEVLIAVIALIMTSILIYGIIINKTDYQQVSSSNEESLYILGLKRGCDIGCIDYDLRVNNKNWSTPESEYNVLESSMYQACTESCINRYNE